MKLIKISLLFSFLPLYSFAIHGPIGSGGGKGIVCSRSIYDSTVYLADTFKYFYNEDSDRESPKESLADLPDLTPEEILLAAASYFEQIAPQKIYAHPFLPNTKVSLGWMVVHTFANLHIRIIQKDLPLIHDDHINLASLPPECRKKIQIAVQNFAQNSIEVNSAYFGELTPAEIGFLWLHETLLAIRGRPGDTSAIRKTVGEVLKKKNFDIYQNVLNIFVQKKSENSQSSSGSDKDKAADLPVLLGIPSSFYCKIMNEKNKQLDLEPPFAFKLKYLDKNSVSEDRKTEFQFVDVKKSKKEIFPGISNLKTFRNARFYSTDKNSRFAIALTWENLNRTEELKLLRYSEYTNEFIGNFTQQINGQGRNTFGVSCQAPFGTINFGKP